MSPLLRLFVASTMVLLVCADPAASGQESDCTAEVEATLEHEDGEHLQFSVEVSTMDSCAKIEYDLVIEERLPNGQANLERKTRVVKLNDGTLTEIVEHTFEAGHSMLGYEAKVIWCHSCEPEG